MSHRVCPYWLGYWLASPLRRLFHNPEKILSPYVKPGMTVLEIGPAMGFFTIPLANIVGATGKVVCVDVQKKMIQALQKRLHRAHLAERTMTQIGKPHSLDIEEFDGKIDFALLFAVVHEIPDVSNFFSEISQALKPGAVCLLAEPKGHVSIRDFEETLRIAKQTSLTIIDNPIIKRSHTSLLQKV